KSCKTHRMARRRACGQLAGADRRSPKTPAGSAAPTAETKPPPPPAPRLSNQTQTAARAPARSRRPPPHCDQTTLTADNHSPLAAEPAASSPASQRQTCPETSASPAANPTGPPAANSPPPPSPKRGGSATRPAIVQVRATYVLAQRQRRGFNRA